MYKKRTIRKEKILQFICMSVFVTLLWGCGENRIIPEDGRQSIQQNTDRESMSTQEIKTEQMQDSGENVTLTKVPEKVTETENENRAIIEELVNTPIPTITSAPTVTPIPSVIPYKKKPADEIVTSENIVDYVETIIDGSDLEYLLAEMSELGEENAYFISTERINRQQMLFDGDMTAISYSMRGGQYGAREIANAVGDARNFEMFLNVGRTISGLTPLKWNKEERMFYTTGERRIADVGNIVVDPNTGEKFKDIYVRRFVAWDYRSAFESGDTFYVWPLYSVNEECVVGYVFEQTSIEFIED